MPETQKLTSTYRADRRLKPCKFCGHKMIGKHANRYGRDVYNFSCMNETCILHRSRNVISISRYSTTAYGKCPIDEEDAIKIINGDLEFEYHAKHID